MTRSAESAESTSSLIAVPADDFKKYNAAMLRLLMALHDYGGTLSTLKLFRTANMSTAYGSKVITKCAAQGYIKRDRGVPMPEGKPGNDMVVNTLTEKGKKLLETLDLA